MRMPNFLFRMIYYILRVAMFFAHPVLHVEGRENIPDGACVICGNHYGMADPIWIVLAFNQKKLFRIMAKEQVMHIPVIGKLLAWAGIIGIKRGENDINAIKTSLKALKSGEQLLIFPEGTRVQGERIEAKTGAIIFAMRADCPILPVYITRKRYPFSSMRVLIGEPYHPLCESLRPKQEELRALTDEMMDKIYKLGEDAE